MGTEKKKQLKQHDSNEEHVKRRVWIFVNDNIIYTLATLRRILSEKAQLIL